jgi:multimeric flavodoxin WrbA
MKILIVSGSPKKEGLCFSCVNAAAHGAQTAGAACEIVFLSDYKLARCAVCGDGWGPCRSEHTCVYGDDGFTEIQKKIQTADKLILDTPVYWGDMTELMKAFFDRFRRCESAKIGGASMAGKQVLLIASPGGSGNGMISCLEQMDRLCGHLGAKIFDYIGVNRWNKDYKLVCIEKAAAALAKSTGEETSFR